MCRSHFNALIFKETSKLLNAHNDNKELEMFLFTILRIHTWDTMYDKLCIQPGYLSKRVERQIGKDSMLVKATSSLLRIGHIKLRF